MNLVTVKIFNNQNDLHLVKSFLESEGIECFVKDELINQVYPIGTDAFGVKLEVMSSQVEKALALLIENKFAKAEDFEPSKEIQFINKLFNKRKK